MRSRSASPQPQGDVDTPAPATNQGFDTYLIFSEVTKLDHDDQKVSDYALSQNKYTKMADSYDLSYIAHLIFFICIY